MRILVTNDDGIDSVGLRELVRVLSTEHEVYVCAPAAERSSYSHSVTYWRIDNTAWKKEVEGAAAAWAVDATPGDCAYYGVNTFLAEKPDLVISGINKGENVNSDIIYSGTVGAASEAILMGVPAMAVSLCTYEERDFHEAALAALKMADLYMADPDRLNYVCNVNIPDLPLSEIKGIKICKYDGWKDFYKDIEMSDNEDGSINLHCPRARGTMRDQIGFPEGDSSAIEAGYISVTPITNDLTYFAEMEHLKVWEKEEF